MSPPLGYVFWHRPRTGTSRSSYEERLLRFQSSLKSNPPRGLVDAFSFREERLPWSRRGPGAYEDWYLVRDFEALGRLNDAALDSENRQSHDQAARKAEAVAGGVYKLLGGKLSPEEVRVAVWIRKPAKTPYRELLGELSESAGEDERTIWQRQMVLGPAPEFCVHCADTPPLPAGLPRKVVPLRPVAERPR